MAEPNPLQIALLILVVIMVFNLIIFVHELGHFWAAKWRGLKIDRFQIWFGKPIWSKSINGVQYGLGWIPAGGFVALPQMAPMEAIEGQNREDEDPLPAISPLDKIIVAFAGPLFSFLLALAAAVIITIVGKPVDVIKTTTVGWVQKDSPAEDAGFQRGDRILSIEGNPVDNWNLPLDSVFMNVVTSKGKDIEFVVDRPGVGEKTLISKFDIPESKWWERRKTRQVGLIPMAPEGPIAITEVVDDENAPARLAGFKAGDVLTEMDGQEVVQLEQVFEAIALSEGKSIEFKVQRGEEELMISVSPTQPVAVNPDTELPDQKFMIGAIFGDAPSPAVREWRKPGPIQQIKDTVRTMWITITTVASPDSSIGIQHLSGPVGIGKLQYYTLLMDFPWHRMLGFMVLININLAILNMLPFPVLDGGHITIATMEAIARRPVNFKLLEMVQLAFVFILFGIMLYVTTKDIPDKFGMGGGEEPVETAFPPATTE
ncbi:MAG: RIP metalloprotease RseP [Verrucomicrobiota bacterium]